MRRLFVGLACLAVACAGEDPESSDGSTLAETLSAAEWAAGHGRVYWASPPGGPGSELFFFDQRELGGVCPADFEEDPFETDMAFVRVWLPSLSGGTFPLVAHPPEDDYGQAVVRVIRAESGETAAVWRAVSGTLTVTPDGDGGDLTIGIEATFATGAEVECLHGIGTPDWCSCIGETGRRFECEGLGCCFGDNTLAFSIDLTSRYCPELCSAVEEPLYEFCEESP